MNTTAGGGSRLKTLSRERPANGKTELEHLCALYHFWEFVQLMSPSFWRPRDQFNREAKTFTF